MTVSVRDRLLTGGLLVTRVSLGCVFLFSSVPKLRYPFDFVLTIYAYELVGPKLALLAAIALPVIELLTGICLIGGLFLGGSLLVSALLAALFVGAQASVVHRGLGISCGCFGPPTGSELVGYITIARSAAALLAAFFGYVCWIRLTSNRKPRLPEPIAT